MPVTYEEREDEIFVSLPLDLDRPADGSIPSKVQFISFSTRGFTNGIVRIHLKRADGKYDDVALHPKGLAEALRPMDKDVVVELGDNRIQRFRAEDWREITDRVAKISPAAVDIEDLMGEHMASILMGRQFCVHWDGPHEGSEDANHRFDGRLSQTTEESYGDDAETAT